MAERGVLMHDADGDSGETPAESYMDDEELRSKEGREHVCWTDRFPKLISPMLMAFQHRRSPSSALTTTIHLVIFLLFIAITYGAYRATKRTRPSTLDLAAMRSNGTSQFPPTTILISLDGFRPDYLHRGLTPHLNAFVSRGVSPEYMLPSFPSVTFPNHFTLVTGLHPESHGVVGNSFWDPELQETFYYTDRAHSMQPKWWTAEPIWETAERQGVRTAIHMWPGSEAHLGGPSLEPAFVDRFNKSELLWRKVQRILTWLDLPGPQDADYSGDSPRPQLIAAYVPDVDADGHHYGPNSTMMDVSIRGVDEMLGQLVDGLEARNLTDIVNVVIVSDHGMAGTSRNRLIQLEDLVDTATMAHVDGWPHYGLRPRDDADIPALYAHLKEQAAQRPGFDVYLRDGDMPARYHFASNPRIAPLWIMPHTGWAVVTRQEYDTASASGDERAPYQPAGIHGYDNQDVAMRAIFMAYGPAFPTSQGHRVAAFQNVEVYNLVCDSVGVHPLPNNGTLRLPLRVLASLADEQHDGDEGDGLHEQHEDVASTALSPQRTAVATHTDAAAGGGDGDSDANTPSSDRPADIPERPTIADGEAEAAAAGAPSDFWRWVEENYEEFSDWIGSVAHIGGGGEDGEAGRRGK